MAARPWIDPGTEMPGWRHSDESAVWQRRWDGYKVMDPLHPQETSSCPPQPDALPRFRPRGILPGTRRPGPPQVAARGLALFPVLSPGSPSILERSQRMSHRSAILRLWVILAGTAGLFWLALAVVAAAGTPPASRWTEHASASQSTYARNATLAAQAETERLAADDYVIVLLSGPPLYDLYAAAAGATAPAPTKRPVALPTLRSWLAAIQARQAEAEVRITNLGAIVVSRYQAALNGLLVHANAQQQREIARLPGVVSVVPAPELRIELDRSVPHIGATQVKDELGLTGKGAVIAIIDMGVDYMHASLGGPGTPEAYAANDPNQIEPGSFPTAKVIGGVDLAGPYYAPNCPAQLPEGARCTTVPEPDDDPLDQIAVNGSAGQGHGSHVAGIAAGAGSMTPGGALGSPVGVAPDAKLVAIKIFGNPIGIANFQPSTRLSYDGLDWLLKHNLGLEVEGVPATDAEGNRLPIHVLNMSVGGAWGGGMELYNQVIGRIVDSGVVAMFSAGNSGDVPYIVSSPGAAEMGLSVANSYASGETGVLFGAAWPGDEISVVAYTSNELLGPTFDHLPPITRVPMAWYGLACPDAEGKPVPPIQDVSGKVALVQRGTCTFAEKFASAAAFGARAVVVFSDDRAPSGMTGTCWPKWPCTDLAGVMISKGDGEKIQAELLAGREVLATFEVYERPELTNNINAGSSRGPGRFSGSVKPQITAPGTNILSVYAGTGFGAMSNSGTSMASPHVAGVAALLWERNQRQQLGLTAADIGALAINYARPVILPETSDPARVVSITRQGAGLVDALASARAGTLLRSDRGLAEIGFGDVFAARQPTSQSRQLTIRNLSDQPKTYALSASFLYPETENQGIVLSCHPPTITVAAKATASVEVQLTADPAALGAWTLPDENRANAMANPGAFAAAEVNGFVVATEVDERGAPVAEGDAPRVPFHTLPHRASCVRAGTAGPIDLRGGPARIAFANPCLQAGGQATYLRIGTDPAEPAYPDKLNITDVGVRWFSSGITDTTHPTVTLDILEFAMRTTGTRRIPYDTQIRVYFDLDLDGKWDKVGWNVRLSGNRWGTLLGTMLPGTLEPNAASAVRSDGSFFTFFEPFDISENVAVLRFMANHPEFGLGLDMDGGKAQFGFGITIWDATGDFEETETYLGYDNAPDNVPAGLERGPHEGAAYLFDQELVDCVRILDESGSPVPGLPELLPLDAGGSAAVTVVGCPNRMDELEKPPLALLVHYPYNLRSESVQVLPFGRIALYLPLAAQNYDFAPAPAEPSATEPAEPGTPTP